MSADSRTFEYHKDLPSGELHIPKVHITSHYPGSGSDPMDYSQMAFSASGMTSTDLQAAIEEAFGSADYFTWGNGLKDTANVISVDYNTTNFKITSEQLNTIQDISSVSSPTFSSLTISNTPVNASDVTRKDYVDLLIQGLDWQKSVEDEIDFTTSEPVSPTSEDRYINTATGTSSQTSQSITTNYIYEWNGTDWTEIIPNEGYTVWVEDININKTFNGTIWVRMAATFTHEYLSGLQGGTSSEYYHMTSIEHTAATRDATNSQNGLMPTAKLTNWDTAYTHSQDHTQAHSDYLLNNASDETSGILTTGGITVTTGNNITVGTTQWTSASTDNINADSIEDGSTNAILTLTQETNWDNHIADNSQAHSDYLTNNAGDTLSASTPYLTLHNTTHEDTDYGREGELRFKGEQTGGEETTLGIIQVAHDGTADDQKGIMSFKVNDGDDVDTLVAKMTIQANGNIGIGTTSPSELLHVASSGGNSAYFEGDVGIGTTNPGAKLEVRGATSTIPIVSSAFLEIGDIVGIGLSGYQSSGVIRIKSAIAHTRVGNYGYGDMLFLVDSNNDIADVAIGDEKMRITNDGNVGIGTTGPDQLLTISSAFSSSPTGNLRFVKTGDNVDGGGSYIQFDTAYQATARGNYNARIEGLRSFGGSGGSSELRFFTTQPSVSAVAQERLRIDYNGNVGIGTTSPTAKFEVSSAGGVNSGINLKLTDGSSYIPIDFNTPSELGGQFILTGTSFSSGAFGGDELALVSELANGRLHLAAIGANGIISFTTGANLVANERMRIDKDGNVGIGTTSPDVNLDVEGSTGISIGENKAGGSNNDEGILKMWSDGDNAFYSQFKTGVQTETCNYTLPLNDGDAGQVLSTDGNGVLSWINN